MSDVSGAGSQWIAYDYQLACIRYTLHPTVDTNSPLFDN